MAHEFRKFMVDVFIDGDWKVALRTDNKQEAINEANEWPERTVEVWDIEADTLVYSH
jgi:hypothetical protein